MWTKKTRQVGGVGCGQKGWRAPPSESPAHADDDRALREEERKNRVGLGTPTKKIEETMGRTHAGGCAARSARGAGRQNCHM